MAVVRNLTETNDQQFLLIKKIGLAAVLLLSALPASTSFLNAQSVAQPHPGRLLACNCFPCHGTHCQSIAGMDKIAGKSANSIYEELKEMQRKPANGNIMNVHARGYTDEQLRLLADYLSRQ